MLKTCLRANVPCVLTYQRALHAYMVTRLRALRAYVRTCQRVLRAYVPYVLTCQNAVCAYVFLCKRAILNNVNLYIIQICYLYLPLKKGNIGETLVNYWDLLI